MSLISISISLLASLSTFFMVSYLVTRILRNRPAPKYVAVKSQQVTRKRKY